MVAKWKKKRHIAHTGTGDIHRRFWRGIQRLIAILEDLDLEGKIILKWAIKKWDGARTGLM